MNTTLLTTFGICFIFFMTCLGVSTIFLLKKDLSQKSLALLVSFSNGIMLASSIWSLLIPSISTSQVYYDNIAVLPVVVGFIAGAGFMFAIDMFSQGSKTNSLKKRKKLSKRYKMFLAISLHNIPEGLSVGVAFGSAILMHDAALMMIAVSLAVGIGLQNVPEGIAVALPMYEHTKSKRKAFLYGFLSGVVEPIAALLGLCLSSIFSRLLPWLLAFAGGTMIYSLAGELTPNTKEDKFKTQIVWTFLAGFLIMMILDVIFA